MGKSAQQKVLGNLRFLPNELPAPTNCPKNVMHQESLWRKYPWIGDESGGL
jgi:hypothetical protein